MELNRIFLYVENMGMQVHFYRDILGFPVLHPTESPDLSQAYFVVLDTGPCRLVLHGGGKKRFGEDAPLLSFHTADIHTGREALIKQGVQLSEIRSPAPGVLVSDGWDPEGNRFSIDQY